MEKEQLMAAVEAILFATGEAVPVKKLATALETGEKEIKEAASALIEKYDGAEHGIKIIEIGEGYQFCTKSEMYEYLIRVAKQPRRYALTDVLLETLSIIAYKQPITKGEIEKIRGVNCVHTVNKLVEFGLVEEVGRLDVPGRPILFGTTEEFLRTFGVKEIDDLPVINQDTIEEFKKQAEEEASVSMDI